jgi:DNA-binding MarR family transcriptional regulator
VTNSDTGEPIGRLADEVIRFVRLGARAKGMLKAGEFGAEFSALMLLFPLRHLGPLRVTDLAELKGADPSTLSRQAAQLVKAGLARREADPEDGRASRLAVTEAGLAACARLQEARTALLREALGDWPEERLRSFTDEALLRSDQAAQARENS